MSKKGTKRNTLPAISSVEKEEIKDAKISHRLFKTEEIRFEVKNVYSLRLLCGLAQNIEYKATEVPAWGFHKAQLVAFLGIQGLRAGEQDEVIRETLHIIRISGIQFKEVVKNRIFWRDMGWISEHAHDPSEPDIIKVWFNPRAVEYLNGIGGYFKLANKYYMNLTSGAQTWLYMFLKDYQRIGSRRISLGDLIIAMSLENTKAYSAVLSKNYKQNFLSRVLGVKRNKATGQWEYTVDKSGNPVGPLAIISKVTDIEVMAECNKDKKGINQIQFTIKSKYNEEEIKIQNVEMAQKLTPIPLEREKSIPMPETKPSKYSGAKTKNEIEQFCESCGMPFEWVLKTMKLEYDEDTDMYVPIK